MATKPNQPIQPALQQALERAQANTRFDDLIGQGIPCREAVFHRPIKSLNVSPAGEPETALYDAVTKAKPSRTAKLWFTPHGLVYEQKYGKSIVPLANVVYSVSL